MRESPALDRVYIREAAELLNRRVGTLRKWDTSGILPENLRPKRGTRGWRYWTPEQIVELRKWIVDTDRRPGKNLAHYNPTEDQIERAIRAMRVPHGRPLGQ